MSSVWKYIIGPEMLWILTGLGIKWLGSRNVPPTEEGSRFLEQFWWWLPLVVVPMTFVCFAVPGPSRWWLLLRIAVTAAVGVCWVSAILTGYVDYRDSRNSGTAAGWIVSTSLGWALIAVGSVVASIVIWWKSRA